MGLVRWRGIYFWELNPYRALEYAEKAASKKQKFAGDIKTPFVIGAHIELGNCLNLMESGSVEILKEAYRGLTKILEEAGKEVPTNEGANRRLDCMVFQHLHESRKDHPTLFQYDTIRCPFCRRRTNILWSKC